MKTKWLNALPKPVGFVFSGGANLGSIQIGMLKALRQAGIEPDLITGTSVGALNGCAIANHGMAKGIEILEDVWHDLEKNDVFPGGVISQAMTLARSKLNVYRNDRLKALIRQTISAERFDQLQIPFAATATELISHQAAAFSTGALEPVLLASTALPGIYPPVDINGTHYIDGGVTDGTPMKLAIKMGANSLVVLDAGGNTCAPTEPPKHVAELMLGVLSSALRQKVIVEAPKIAQTTPVLFLPRPCTDGLSLLDFSRGRELMAEGHDLAAHFLEKAAIPQAGAMVGAPHLIHEPSRL